MPPRRKRRAPPAKEQPPPSPPPQSPSPPPEPARADATLAERLTQVSNQERARRIAAIRAVEEAEGESTRSWLQLAQSYFSNEQLDAKALDYFRENLPNLSVAHTHTEKHGALELKWNDGDTCVVGDLVDDRILRASIASLPTVGGLQFPGNSGLSMLGVNYLQVKWQAQQMLFRHPGFVFFFFPLWTAMSNRLSLGMTPKTVRLPKNGEMLLSVHGSPLGVYKEENLAAIHESGNGSEDAPC
ncbi:hypothetical protein EJB05_19394 [Eragrostis curvula]|uniref:Uncharacterized protein n=1 Tax=Eragrostis curvula TaxID=38414 RepID=A0A5J9UVW5_9POAL|nr:hypothetical protein EJB05_19394 [Eragrostis curvula]